MLLNMNKDEYVTIRNRVSGDCFVIRANDKSFSIRKFKGTEYIKKELGVE